jgi:hypothetical protein
MERTSFVWESEYLREAEYPWEANDLFECHFSKQFVFIFIIKVILSLLFMLT